MQQRFSFILQSNTHTHQPEYFFIRKYFFFMLPQCSRQTITLDRVTNNSLRKRELTSTKKQCSKGSVGPQSAGSWGLTQWVLAQHSLQQQMSPTAPPCRPEGPKQFQTYHLLNDFLPSLCIHMGMHTPFLWDCQLG